MKAALFCRVSSKEQELEGYSLQSQEKLNREYTLKNNFDIAEIFSISESAGGKKQREIFEQMMAKVRKEGINVLVCEKVDRLTRNLRDALSINDWINEDAENQVHFVKENVILNRESRSNEKFIWNIKVSVAQYYLDNLSEEVKKGQKEKLAQGWLPTRPPMGYKTIGEQGKRVHIVDQKTVHYAKRMFDLYASGNYSTARITEALYQDGLRSSGGRKVPKSRIHEYLSDPFYIGVNRWNGQLHPGKQESLVTLETFEKVQRLLHGKSTPRHRTHNFLFRGVIHCAECRGVVTWETQKGHRYGHCNHYRNCSQSHWSKEFGLVDQTSTRLADLIIHDKQIANILDEHLATRGRNEVIYNDQSLATLKEQSERLEKRLETLYDDKADDNISKELYLKKKTQYTLEKSQIDKQIEEFGTKPSVDNGKLDTLRLSQVAHNRFKDSIEVEPRREILHLAFQEITLSEDILHLTFSPSFQLMHLVASSINGSKELRPSEVRQKIFELPLIATSQPVKQSKTPSLSTERPAWLPR